MHRGADRGVPAPQIMVFCRGDSACASHHGADCALSATDHGEMWSDPAAHLNREQRLRASDHGELVQFRLRCRLWPCATDYGEIMEVCSWNVVRTARDFWSP